MFRNYVFEEVRLVRSLFKTEQLWIAGRVSRIFGTWANSDKNLKQFEKWSLASLIFEYRGAISRGNEFWRVARNERGHRMGSGNFVSQNYNSEERHRRVCTFPRWHFKREAALNTARHLSLYTLYIFARASSELSRRAARRVPLLIQNIVAIYSAIIAEPIRNNKDRQPHYYLSPSLAR